MGELFGEATLMEEVAIPPTGELTWTIPPGEVTMPDTTLGEPIPTRPAWLAGDLAAPWLSGKGRDGQEPRI